MAQETGQMQAARPTRATGQKTPPRVTKAMETLKAVEVMRAMEVMKSAPATSPQLKHSGIMER